MKIFIISFIITIAVFLISAFVAEKFINLIKTYTS